MQRKVIIHIEPYEGEKITIPELFERLVVNQDAPPVPHHIVERGLIYSPSPNVPAVVSLQGLQFWQEWTDRYLEPALSPSEYVQRLNEIRDSRRPVRFVIASDIEAYRMDEMVLINFREWAVDVKFEDAITYSLDVYKFEPHVIKELEIDSNGNITEKEEPRDDNRPPNGRTHTVVSGDSLIRIARKFGQPDSAWRELYQLNKDIIHARGNQNLIFPGQIFNIPETWGEKQPTRTVASQVRQSPQVVWSAAIGGSPTGTMHDTVSAQW